MKVKNKERAYHVTCISESSRGPKTTFCQGPTHSVLVTGLPLVSLIADGPQDLQPDAPMWHEGLTADELGSIDLGAGLVPFP